MMSFERILCPVDFTDASAGALRYAAAVATHFGARLIVLTVEDPVLTEALDLGTGIMWTPDHCKKELAQFAAKTFGAGLPVGASLEYRVARERSSDLIVVSTHGLTGMRKLFFGSTTERVLRETTTPVLVTPAHDPGPIRLEDAKQLIGRIIVPVDLSSASAHQIDVARGIAGAVADGIVRVERAGNGRRAGATRRRSRYC